VRKRIQPFLTAKGEIYHVCLLFQTFLQLPGKPLVVFDYKNLHPRLPSSVSIANLRKC
jgi:hypothetical protein